MTGRVVIVDDDPAFLVAVRRLLLAHGLRVVGEASSVASGLAVATRLRPEAMLVDVMLPDGDGTALVRSLAGAPWRPLMLLTSSDPDVLAPDDLRIDGIVGFIPKENLPDAPLQRLLGPSGGGFDAARVR